jgi:hypothetical protein
MTLFIDAQRLASSQEETGVSTGSSQLDELTGGFKDETLYLFYGEEELTNALFTHLLTSSRLSELSEKSSSPAIDFWFRTPLTLRKSRRLSTPYRRVIFSPLRFTRKVIATISRPTAETQTPETLLRLDEDDAFNALKILVAGVEPCAITPSSRIDHCISQSQPKHQTVVSSLEREGPVDGHDKGLTDGGHPSIYQPHMNEAGLRQFIA